MSTPLKKGQKADITKQNPSIRNLVVGMGWRDGGSIEVDFSAFLLNASGKASGDADLIFYSNPKGASGSVEIMGAKSNLAGKTDREQVLIRLEQVPTAVDRIAFTLTIYEGDARRQNFSGVDDAYIRVIDETSGTEIVHYNLGKDFSVETAIIVGELYRYNGQWKFSAVGSGYSGGLGALCKSFGIEIAEEQTAATASVPPTQVPQAQPVPPKAPPTPPVQAPRVQPAPSEPARITPVPPAPPVQTAPVNLSKITLQKRGDVINLTKKSGSIGEILINLNWNQQQKKSGGFFAGLKGGGGVDLDLGCLFELKDGYKGTVQALGNAFGSLQHEPYISLDGDDRTGSNTGGENLRINGNQVSRIKRIVVYAFIYEGAANWAEANGVVTLKQPDGPDIEVVLDEHNNRKGMCAIAMIENVNDQTFSVRKLVEYFSGHRELDKAYNWGLNWTRGSK